MISETTTDNKNWMYVFPLKLKGDLTVAIRLLEVLGLKPGEYRFNSIGRIEVSVDKEWDAFLTDKIKELGFEDILNGKAYSNEAECEYDYILRDYIGLDHVNDLYESIKRDHKLNKIEVLRTDINHLANTIKITYRIISNSKINVVDYAVALAIYNRCFYSLNSNGLPIMNIDAVINSTTDKDVKHNLKLLKNMFL